MATQSGEVESAEAAKFAALQREIAECRQEPGTTLDMLHAVQRQFGYLEPEAVGLVADAIGLTKAQLYGVATFYTMFFFEPKPPVIARVCVNLFMSPTRCARHTAHAGSGCQRTAACIRGRRGDVLGSLRAGSGPFGQRGCRGRRVRSGSACEGSGKNGRIW